MPLIGLVLHTIKSRFLEGKIYTFIGDILIAINPFSDAYESLLYGSEKIETIKQSSTNEAHIYGVARRALSSLMQEGRSQSIVISGESGSGKTRSCHHILNYLVALSDHADPNLLRLVCFPIHMVLDWVF